MEETHRERMRRLKALKPKFTGGKRGAKAKAASSFNAFAIVSRRPKRKARPAKPMKSRRPKCAVTPCPLNAIKEGKCPNHLGW